MVGLNYGASFVPYFTTVLWDLHGTGPIVLIIIVGSSMLIPLPLLYIARCVSFIHIRDQLPANINRMIALVETTTPKVKVQNVSEFFVY